MTEAVPAAAGGESIRPYAAAWLVACAILIAANAKAIATFTFPDPDDTLRLLQVRDWLAGQSWFDLRQHRMNLPEGAPMHWSRLVDIPIAATILLLRPLLGDARAELAALIVVPLVTLGVVMALVALLTRRLLDRPHAILATFIVPVSIIVTHQLRPMRIDHHGWQIVLALAALLAALHPDRRRSGVVAGSMAAIWLSISLEGLPFAAALVALAAIRWLGDPREGERLAATAVSLAGVSLLLFVATKDSAGWTINHCDAISPAHLAVLVLGAFGSVLVTSAGLSALPGKIASLAGVGAAALTSMIWIAPNCSAGPFERLDPLVYNFWYLNIQEGLPLWWQKPEGVIVVIGLPIVGILGSWVQLRKTQDRRRVEWAGLLFLLIAAALTAVFVQRAGAVANLFAIPGAVALFKAAQVRIEQISAGPKRLLAMLASLAIVAPGHTVAIAGSFAGDDKRIQQTKRAKRCTERDYIRVLNRLPASDIAAPIDLGPSILINTHHRIIASGHHRNAAAMHDLIRIFLAQPGEARSLLRQRGIDYVVICPELPEAAHYERRSPHGMMARLAGGRAPAWLEPLQLERGQPISIWRVRQGS